MANSRDPLSDSHQDGPLARETSEPIHDPTVPDIGLIYRLGQVSTQPPGWLWLCSHPGSIGLGNGMLKRVA